MNKRLQVDKKLFTILIYFLGMAGYLSGDGEKQKQPCERLNFWQKSQEKGNV